MTSDQDCGCCPPAVATTPRPLHNRPGLPDVSYRVGEWADFRSAMLAALSARSATSSPLAELRTRDTDDPTLALLDAWAVACDVLTFYTERLVQESFLGTAVERLSLQQLGRLVDYRLDPGVAAETLLAFSLERPPDAAVAAATSSIDPGLHPPAAPVQVRLPIGLRVQSVPGPGEQPQTFETVQELGGRPEWNALPVTTGRPFPPTRGRASGWFAGTATGLRPGHAVLITGLTPSGTDLVNDHWDMRLASTVEIDQARSATHVSYEWRLGSAYPINDPAAAPAAFALRKRLTVFGHNAPVWQAMHIDFRTGYARSLTSVDADITTYVAGAEWPLFNAARTRSDGLLEVDLDGAHADVVTGSWVVVSKEDGNFYRELYEVVARAELSRAGFGISGPVTRLVLRGEAAAFGNPRQVTVLAVSEPLVITEAPDEADLEGQEVFVDGDAADMLNGRTVVVSGRTSGEGIPVAEAATVESADAVGPAPSGGPRTKVRLTRPLEHAYRRASTVLYGNIARATHGATVHEVLGSGDARRTFQTFELTQGPLTHVQAANADGAASTLRVAVDDVTWQEVRSHYSATPAEQTFTSAPGATVNPATGRSVDQVVFGDGRRGARLPSGSLNVRATYRKGLGQVGNLSVGQLAQPLDRPLGLKAASNPVPAAGGVDPEDEGAARRSIPVSIRTLGRAVSLTDYADFSLAFAGVSRAAAEVLPLRAGRTVVVSVCGPRGTTAAASTIEHLQAALQSLGDPQVRVQVAAALVVRFRLALRIAVTSDPVTVEAAVLTALAITYGAPAREIGEPIHSSAVIATVAGVPGVVGVDLDRLYRVGSGELVARPARVGADGALIGAELLALSDNPAGPVDWLDVTT